MDKANLFSIGEFSQLTGVSIKALHYYEKINILKPAYIDSTNNYRYYALYQVRQVSLIELFLDLDIRLSQLPQFISGDFQKVSYEKILEHGRSLTKQKINELENKMRYIDFLETQASSCNFNTQIPLWLLSNKYASSIEEALKQILTETRSYQLSLTDSYGRILICNKKKQRLYYYAVVRHPSHQRVIHENLFYLPDGEYRTITCEHPSLEHSCRLFEDLFQMEYDKIVLETPTACSADTFQYCLHCMLPTTTPL